MAPVGPGITIDSPPPQSTLFSHLALVIGRCNPSPPAGSSVTVTTSVSPPLSFPVHSSGRFKALVPLAQGQNTFTIACGPHSTQHHVTYQPLPSNRPVSLVIVAGRDSQLCYDDTQPTNCDDAIKRLRMVAYMWQAYTAEQMMRNRFGPRTFQFDEEWGVDTTIRGGQQAMVAKVTVVRSKYSVAEIRDTNRAQQNKSAGKPTGPGLYQIAREAVEGAPEFRDRKKDVQAACLIMDSTKARDGLIVGHAALGGSGLAIFGSHTTFSWPSCIDEVVPKFLDQRPVDTRYCGIDCEGKTYGMAANVGIGAMMHEVGHMLGCPHQTSGVMLRDYVRLHKSFIAVDPDDSNECAWHRLDALRFLGSSSFTAPWDPPRPQSTGGILVTASSTALELNTPDSLILAVEYRKPGEETAEPWVDLSMQPTQQYSIPRNKLSGFDRITILANDGGKLNDFQLEGIFPQSGEALRTPGFGRQNGTAVRVQIPPNLSLIRVHAGAALDGIELQPGNLIVGKRGGRPHDFALKPGEQVVGFNVRHGAWMDGIQFVTTHRVSPMFGRADGGGPGEARVPPGYRWSALSGHVGQWCNGLGFEFEPIQSQNPGGYQQQGGQQAPFQAGGQGPPPQPNWETRPGAGNQQYEQDGHRSRLKGKLEKLFR